ncbi:hypothetical protein PJW08_09475 [Tenacibaculum finnmarkense]|nr:hypothetical protein PJW08_09475 [Tenacibaculum finnmarkense]
MKKITIKLQIWLSAEMKFITGQILTTYTQAVVRYARTHPI